MTLRSGFVPLHLFHVILPPVCLFIFLFFILLPYPAKEIRLLWSQPVCVMHHLLITCESVSRLSKSAVTNSRKYESFVKVGTDKGEKIALLLLLRGKHWCELN